MIISFPLNFGATVILSVFKVHNHSPNMNNILWVRRSFHLLKHLESIQSIKCKNNPNPQSATPFIPSSFLLSTCTTHVGTCYPGNDDRNCLPVVRRGFHYRRPYRRPCRYDGTPQSHATMPDFSDNCRLGVHQCNQFAKKIHTLQRGVHCGFSVSEAPDLHTNSKAACVRCPRRRS